MGVSVITGVFVGVRLGPPGVIVLLGVSVGSVGIVGVCVGVPVGATGMVGVCVGVTVDVAVFGGGPVGVRVGLPVEVGVLVAATAVAVRVNVGVLVEAIGVAVRVRVGVLLACVVFVGSGVLVLVAVGVDVLPPLGRTSRNTPVIGPHVWKPP